MAHPKRLALWTLALAAVASACPAAHGQGYNFAAVGPVNKSMAGASTALPLDSAGAIFWNPATISGLPCSEVEFATDMLYARSTTSSAVPANALAPGFPPAPMADTTHDEAGVFPLPVGGFVYKPEHSPWAFGLGVFVAGGFGTNYPGSLTNPVFTPPPPAGAGFGPLTTEFVALQIVPTLAYQLTDRLSVGFSPIVDLTRLSFDPGVLFSPDDANGDGAAHYPTATHTRYHWGGGFSVGLYYLVNQDWRLGASFKSPQWYEPLRYHSADELGRPRDLSLRFDYPFIVSVGTAYTGIDRFSFALDFRFIDYKDSKLAGDDAGFDPTGAITGLGWDNVFAVAFGVQYQLTECLALRAGYTFNTNPIPDRNAAFNVGAPLSYMHQLGVGGTCRLTQTSSLHLTYYRAFENDITGPIFTPAGPIPGSSVTTGGSGDLLALGVTVHF